MSIKDEKGLTGIDIAISIILITIFISIIGNLIVNINLNSKNTQRKTIATSYAIQEIEKIKAQGYIDNYNNKGIETEDILKEEDILDNASYYGRIFARSGGLSDAVKEALKENNITDFDLKAVTCDGIEQCKIALLKKNKNLLDGNFIEGMACLGGCIGGAGCLTHGEKNKAEVDKYGMEAYEKTISDAISIVKMTK